MTKIKGEITIRRPMEVVFDYVADQTNEPEDNPMMVRADKDTAGPIGKSTRFRSAVRSAGRIAEMVIENTLIFERVNEESTPTAWATRGLHGNPPGTAHLDGSEESPGERANRGRKVDDEAGPSASRKRPRVQSWPTRDSRSLMMPTLGGGTPLASSPASFRLSCSRY